MYVFNKLKPTNHNMTTIRANYKTIINPIYIMTQNKGQLFQ